MYRIRYLKRAVALVIGLVVAIMPGERTVRSVQAQPSVQTVVEPEAVSNTYLHTVWTIEDGLPQNTVSAILQTRDGYLWLATLGGLARFDGISFTVFDVANAPGLASNRMVSLYEDGAGTLWVGHETGEITAYKDGTFVSYGVDDGLPGRFVNTFIEDQAGNLWIGTKQGLVRLKDGVFTTYTTDDGLPHNQVYSLLVDREERLWMGTDNGVARFEAGRFIVYSRENGFPGLVAAPLFEDREGRLWASTSRGLAYYHDDHFLLVESTGERLGPIQDIEEDRYGHLWVGIKESHQLLRLAWAARTPDSPPEVTVRFSFKDPIHILFEDREANLWVGTDGGGLHRFRQKPILRYTMDDGLAENSVFRVLSDSEGAVWFNAGCDNLTRYYEGTLTTYTTMPDGGMIGCVWSLLQDRSGVLWIGSENTLIRWDKQGYTRYTPAGGLPGADVVSLFEDREGILWIGTSENGVVRYDGETFRTYSTEDGLVHGDVRFIMQSRDGGLWLGTREGVSRFEEDSFTNYTAEDGLSPGMVRALHEDADGTLWAGTYGGGLSRLKDGTITRYTMDDGLFDNVISRILEDDRGNLWMLGNLGLFYVNRQELNDFAEGRRATVESVSLGPDEGMAEGNGGGQPAGWQTDDGKMWFPTIEGLAVIDVRNFRPNEVPPPVVIERVLINETDIDFQEAVEVPPGLRSMEIHYAGLSFSAPEKVRFRYKLEGYDAVWQDVGGRRVAFYTNLSPGQYTFQVKAANNDGVWNEVGAALTLSLTPHFYETVWFYVLCVLLLGWAGYAGYRVRTRSIQTQNIRLQAEIDERIRAEEAVKENEARLHALVESVRDYIWSVDTQYCLLTINTSLQKSYQEAYGVRLDIGDNILEKTPDPEVSAFFKMLYDRAFAGEQFSVELPSEQEGQMTHLEIFLNPIHGQDATVQGVSAFAQDITDRWHAKQALQESEAENRLLIENASYCIHQIDIGGRLVSMNQAGLRMMDVEAEEAIKGMLYLDAVADRDREQVDQFLQAALQGTPSEFEFEATNGHFFASSFIPITDEHGAVIRLMGMTRDITIRKQAERALQESEERYRRLVEFAPIAISVFHTDGTIRYANRANLVLLGATHSEEVVGTNVFSYLVEQQDFAKASARFQQLKQGKAVDLVEHIIQRQDGERRHVEISSLPIIYEGKPAGQSVMIDITERIHAEAALRVSEEKFSKAFRASPDAIIISSLTDGTIVDVNDGFTRTSGFSRDEAIGHTTLDLGVWVDEADRDRILEALRTEGRIRDYECRFYDKSGAIRICLDSAELIEIEGKKRILSVLRDISERKKAIEDREELIIELEARNAELERFTYTVSHDLKTPLVTIKGFLGLLKQDTAHGDVERMESDIKQISRAADTMARLLSELLELSRIGRLMNPPKAVGLSELAIEAASLVAGRLTARGILVEIDPSMPVVQGDRVRLLEVYQNLIDNAAKFMGEQEAPYIEIGAQRQNGEITCFVKDNGVGIAPKYHDNIFGLFNRLDVEEEGTGIGLALVKRIVEVHGGRIWVESVGERKGSVFHFTLPEQEA